MSAVRRQQALVLFVALAVTVAAGCGDDEPAADETTTTATATTGHDADHRGHDRAALSSAILATAGFQDVDIAEAASYLSTIDTLGCFHDTERGGMGVHYLNESLLDDQLDPAAPEALVYELDSGGDIVGLAGLEYIVPIEAWTADEPPNVLGLDLHQHPTLPLWVLHAWIWKANPAGTFEDFNPSVRACPESVPVFGVDLP